MPADQEKVLVYDACAQKSPGNRHRRIDDHPAGVVCRIESFDRITGNAVGLFCHNRLDKFIDDSE